MSDRAGDFYTLGKAVRDEAGVGDSDHVHLLCVGNFIFCESRRSGCKRAE